MKLTASWKSGGVSSSRFSNSAIPQGSLLFPFTSFVLCAMPVYETRFTPELFGTRGAETKISLHNRESSKAVKSEFSTAWDSPANHSGNSTSPSSWKTCAGTSGASSLISLF